MQVLMQVSIINGRVIVTILLNSAEEESLNDFFEIIASFTSPHKSRWNYMNFSEAIIVDIPHG